MTLNIKFREGYLYFFLLYISSTVLFCQVVLSFYLIPDTKGEDKDLFYQSQRYYDPKLSRFTQPDNIVPTAEVIDLNRFAYVRNNPIKYNDPSGHVPYDVLDDAKAALIDAATNFDKSLYEVAEFIGQMMTPPKFEKDPVGLLAFGMLSSGSSMSNAVAARTNRIVYARAAVESSAKNARLSAASASGVRRSAISERSQERLRRVGAELDAFTGSSSMNISGATWVAANEFPDIASAVRLPDNLGYILIRPFRDHPQFKAWVHADEIDALARESAVLRAVNGQTNRLAKGLGDLLNRHLNSGGPIGQMTLSGHFIPEIVAALKKGWLYGGDAFAVTHSSWMMVGPTGGLANGATRTTTFSYLGQTAQLRVIESVQGDGYVRLRYDLAERGIMDLPEGIGPKPSDDSFFSVPGGD